MHELNQLVLNFIAVGFFFVVYYYYPNARWYREKNIPENDGDALTSYSSYTDDEEIPSLFDRFDLPGIFRSIGEYFCQKTRTCLENIE